MPLPGPGRWSRRAILSVTLVGPFFSSFELLFFLSFFSAWLFRHDCCDCCRNSKSCTLLSLSLSCSPSLSLHLKHVDCRVSCLCFVLSAFSFPHSFSSENASHSGPDKDATLVKTGFTHPFSSLSLSLSRESNSVNRVIVSADRAKRQAVSRIRTERRREARRRRRRQKVLPVRLVVSLASLPSSTGSCWGREKAVFDNEGSSRKKLSCVP